MLAAAEPHRPLAEDAMRDRFELGAHFLQRVGMTIDDRLQQADEQVRAAVRGRRGGELLRGVAVEQTGWARNGW